VTFGVMVPKREIQRPVPTHYGSKPDPATCIEPHKAKRLDGSDVLAYRPIQNRPGCQ
jgi:hypothetical protein